MNSGASQALDTIPAERETSLLVGLDIGGSFTDIVLYDSRSGETRYRKAGNRTGDLLQSVRECLAELQVPWADVAAVKHGTTVVINTIIERRGARVALLTTEGFRDVLEIGRTNWPEPYNLRFDRLPPLVPRDLRFEVRERMGADGQAVTPLSDAAIAAAVDTVRRAGVEAVAVCFLHAYLNPDHEKRVGAALKQAMPSLFVTLSHELSREFREFERTSTVATNAYVGPAIDRYLQTLNDDLRQADFAGQLFLMESSGGASTIAAARSHPVVLVESGPAAGAIAVAQFAHASGLDNVIAFDMGGTTAKATLVEGGQPLFTSEYYVPTYERGYPVRVPAIDIVEVGTGGGSIASLDEVGAISVGPRSAGSFPGPACFGQGGVDATVTDANVLLGRIDPENFRTGTVRVQRDLAGRAIAAMADRIGSSVEDMAAGILRIANFNMAIAIRKVSLERGRDPRDFALYAYGGGGPLHAVEMARDLYIPEVVIPRMPSNLSALGTLMADLRTDVSRTVMQPLDALSPAQWTALFGDMTATVAAWHKAPAETLRIERFGDLRYKGQEFTLRINLDAADAAETSAVARERFRREYRTRYGHVYDEVPIELVNLWLVGFAPVAKPPVDQAPAIDPAPAATATRPVFFPGHGWLETPVLFRDRLASGSELKGPAVIEEYGATTCIGPRDTLAVDRLGQLRIRIGLDPDATDGG